VAFILILNNPNISNALLLEGIFYLPQRLLNHTWFKLELKTIREEA
jgi:hypothetical protein